MDFLAQAAGLSQLIAAFPALLTLTGLLAALVSLITQATKGLGFLKRIPTDLQVILLSEMLSLTLLLAWASRAGTALTWYMPVGAVIGGLLVAFIAMYGWATWFDLMERFDHSLARGGSRDRE